MDNYDEDDIHKAARLGKTREIVRQLGNGVSINLENASQQTPLHVAASHGKDDAVIFLLEKGAKPTKRDSSQCIPLHYAAAECNLAAVRALVKAGGKNSVNFKCETELTPAGYAEKIHNRKKNHEVLVFLRGLLKQKAKQ